MTVKQSPSIEWREQRRQAAREAIVDAAWALVREEGLGSLSLRDLAGRAGITTPTVYAYFESKNAIFDAMFGRAARDFDARMAQPYDTEDPREILLLAVRRFVEYCTADVGRYQLLFQRSVPGFEPSPESFSSAIKALDRVVEQLALNGVTDRRFLDMWTAMLTGLVDQQISNDPGGQRWVVLIDDVVEMFLAHCQSRLAQPTRSRRPPADTRTASTNRGD